MSYYYGSKKRGGCKVLIEKIIPSTFGVKLKCKYVNYSQIEYFVISKKSSLISKMENFDFSLENCKIFLKWYRYPKSDLKWVDSIDFETIEKNDLKKPKKNIIKEELIRQKNVIGKTKKYAYFIKNNLLYVGLITKSDSEFVWFSQSNLIEDNSIVPKSVLQIFKKRTMKNWWLNE